MKSPIKCGVYCIRNIANNKVYIGSSEDIGRRWWRHKADLNKNKHSNLHLQNAWNKYGKNYFELSLVEECSILLLVSKEDFWMEHYNSRNEFKGYNLASANRTVWSEQSRRKAPLSHMGAKNINFGKKRPKEVIDKILKTKAERGYNHSEEWRKRQSEFMKGKSYGLGYKHTEEAKIKMREARKKRVFLKETKRKISESKKDWWSKKKLRNNPVNLSIDLNTINPI